MRSFRTHSFNVAFAQLPKHVQKATRKAFKLGLADPSHPSIEFKELFDDIWSARVTRSYRALALRQDGDFYWTWIGTHAGYDRRI